MRMGPHDSTNQELRTLELIGLPHQVHRKVLRQLKRLALVQAMLRDELAKESTIYAAGYIMPRGNRQERTRIVVEPDRVVEACRLGGLLTETRHALRRIVEPPGRAQAQARVMPSQRCEFPAERRLVQR